MGNCCCDRRDQMVAAEEPKEANTVTNDIYQKGREKQDEVQEIEVKRQSGGQSTTESDTKEVRNSQAIASFRELLHGLEQTDELSKESQIVSHTWLGTLDMASAQFAIKVILLLQGQDFANNSMIRFAYYSTLKQENSLNLVVKNLHANKRCVSLVHDLLILNILPVLERALLANETAEYHLCISNTLHCLYCRNLFLQSYLVDPAFHPLLTHFINLLTKFTDPRMIRIHAENLSDFATKYDGMVLIDNWKCLETLGLTQQIEKSREKLERWRGTNLDEVAKADLALRRLLASGLTANLQEESRSPPE